MVDGSTTRRERYRKRHQDLLGTRSPIEVTWRKISEVMAPDRLHLDPQSQAQNQGKRNNTRIYNGTGVQALDTLAAGMQAGVTPAWQKWHALTLADKDLAKHPAVKRHLEARRDAHSQALLASNFYYATANCVYPDLGSFATSAFFLEKYVDDDDDGFVRLHFNEMCVGEYALAVDAFGRVNTCYRDIWRSCHNIIERFGLKNVSKKIREAYDKGNYSQLFHVVHAVQPNDEYETGMLDRHGMKFASCWFEPEADGADKDRFLEERGYRSFPVVAPRWSVQAGETYGRGPGWKVLGDLLALQHKEVGLATLYDLVRQQPLNVPEGIGRVAVKPGAINHSPAGETHVKVEPSIDVAAVHATIGHAKEDILRDEDRVREGMYVDLFKKLIADQRNQPKTAEEIRALEREKMSMLGPVLQNLDVTMLEPVIEGVDRVLAENGMLPEIPPELQGMAINIEFQSVLHQVQQVPRLGAIRTLVGELVGLANAGHPEVLDKINADVIADHILVITGAPVDSLLSKEEVEPIRQQKAEQEQAARQGEAALTATEGARNLASVDPQRLSELAASIAPIAGAQGSMG
jgi:hypothetical protein